MKLKTLKDLRIGGIIEGNKSIIIEETDLDCCSLILKQEAIKDIKAIQTLGKTPEEKMWEEITKKMITYSKDAKQGIINYIKWKFNLTEEDLLIDSMENTPSPKFKHHIKNIK